MWDIDQEISEHSRQTIPLGCPEGITFLPVPVREKLMAWAHTTIATGHPGTHRTYKLLQERYW